jgi:hypothetical protein
MKMNQLMTMVCAGAVVVSFTSCGGGWDDETKKELKSTCTELTKISYEETDAVAICECYVEGLVAKYPKADFTSEQAQADMEKCMEGHKSTFEMQMEQDASSMDMGSDTLSTPEGTTEEAAH